MADGGKLSGVLRGRDTDDTVWPGRAHAQGLLQGADVRDCELLFWLRRFPRNLARYREIQR